VSNNDVELLTIEQVMDLLLAVETLRRFAVTCVLPASDTATNGAFVKRSPRWITRHGAASAFQS